LSFKQEERADKGDNLNLNANNGEKKQVARLQKIVRGRERLKIFHEKGDNYTTRVICRAILRK
jgi:uncharacterized protein Veg